MATEHLKYEYNSLQMENYQYEKLIRQQEDYLVSLDREIPATKGRIQEKSAVPGGILEQEGKHKYLKKHIYILENKVDQATVEFDELMCRNRNYSKDIAHLLEWKGITCTIEEKINRQMAKLEETLMFFSNQRSQAETQMLEARGHIKTEADQIIEAQMQLEIQRVIDHDAKLYAFMERKLQEITPLGDEDSKKRKEQQQHQNRVKELEIYKQAHSALLEVTGETDLHQIGHLFVQTEQENFAHMNYINEQHNRGNMLKNSANKMKSEILFLDEELKRQDEQSKNHLKDLESELERYSCLAESLENYCTEVLWTLDQLIAAISDLLKEMTHGDAIITYDNITHVINILEESFNNLLNQANDVEDKDSLLLANSDLLPECEAVVELEHGRTPSHSLKSACSGRSITSDATGHSSLQF